MNIHGVNRARRVSLDICLEHLSDPCIVFPVLQFSLSCFTFYICDVFFFFSLMIVAAMEEKCLKEIFRLKTFVFHTNFVILWEIISPDKWHLMV